MGLQAHARRPAASPSWQIHVGLRYPQLRIRMRHLGNNKIKKQIKLSPQKWGFHKLSFKQRNSTFLRTERKEMGVLPLQSPPLVTRFPPSSWTRVAMGKPSSSSCQRFTFPSNSQRCPDTGNLGCVNFRILASGSSQVATGSIPETADATAQDMYSEDTDLVFVAGATGRVGSRTVRELLRLGFRVRAGVRSAQRAETLVQSVQQVKLDDAVGSPGTQPVERLEIVECDLENRSAIGPGIGSASIVICCIGASEKEVFDITGPYRIDYQASKNLIEAATLAKVKHFILLTSLGTNKIGFPAAILNLFWGVLVWKRKAEEALIASGLPYTIVRPGGMERPTDSYKETHNIVLANEDTYFGGQVSNLQVAELMAFMAKNRRLSLNKVVEVIAETTVPMTPMETLLAKIPPQKETPLELQPNPVAVRVESETTKPAAEVEPSQIEQPKERPLSPYTVTPDETSSADEARVEIHVELQKTRPLSPFTMYEDLKPPTSPQPSVPKF